jgi:hypothetical protein
MWGLTGRGITGAGEGSLLFLREFGGLALRCGDGKVNGPSVSEELWWKSWRLWCNCVRWRDRGRRLVVTGEEVREAAWQVGFHFEYGTPGRHNS